MGIEREKGGWVARGINKMADDGEWREDTEITLTLLEKGHREKVGDSKKTNVYLLLPIEENKSGH